MLHMLTCFDLKPAHTLEAFEQSLDQFTDQLRALDLVEHRGPVGRRVRDTILDTDTERSHQYFMLMQFRDRAQSDKAVSYIQSESEPTDSTHRTMYSMVENMIFICWQDIQS